MPVTPSTTMSSTPSQLDDTTGRSIAIASIRTMPNASAYDGIAKMSNDAITSGTSFLNPENLTTLSSFSERHILRIRCSYACSPWLASPTIRNRMLLNLLWRMLAASTNSSCPLPCVNRPTNPTTSVSSAKPNSRRTRSRLTRESENNSVSTA